MRHLVFMIVGIRMNAKYAHVHQKWVLMLYGVIQAVGNAR